MSTKADRLKCRFCGWSTLKFRTRKDGKTVPGWNRLRDHVAEAHPEEHRRLQDALGPEDDA